MATVRSVTIVGAGISGLALASSLARLGCDVTVIEKGRREDQLGTGINLQANALRALRALGLADACLARGFAWNRVNMRSASGEMFGEQELPWPHDPELPKALGIMRTDLATILAAAAVASDVRIRYETTVTMLEQSEDSVTVTLSDGTQRRSDILVAADGVYSQTRSTVFGDKHVPHYAGQGVWRYTIPRPDTLDGFTIFRAPDRPALGCLPLSDESSYLFLLENAAQPMHFANDRLSDHLRERLSEFSAPEVRRAADEIVPGRHISFRWFDILLMPPPWHCNRVVLIGDAAHSLTPQLTSGAGVAIEDAVVLLDELETSRTIEEALASFSKRRWPRVKTVFENSLRISQLERAGIPDPDVTNKLMLDCFALLAEPW